MTAQPDLRALNTFLTVVKHGSMTAAAVALGYVPSAVSQQISRLERSIGASLFVRTAGSRVVATREGRELALGATQLFVAAARFQDLAHQVSELDASELRIGAYGTATSHLLPPVLAKFRELNSTAGIHVTEVETDEGLPLVLNGQIDLLVAYRYLPEDPPKRSDQLKLYRLGREEMVLAAAKESDQPAPTLKECQDRDWVAGAIPAADGRLLAKWASSLNFTPRVAFNTPDCHTQIALVSRGLAVGLIPATVARAWKDPEYPICTVQLPHSSSAYREVLSVTRPGLGSSLINDLAKRLSAALSETADLNQPAAPKNRRSK